jgi:hypothetical protein
VATLATSADERAARARSQPFPYDPACAWGRLSDGKGFRIRCLTRDEAVRLGAPGPAPASSASPAEPERPADATGFVVQLGPITADQGAFPEGVPSLNKGMAKYEACLRDHGGLTEASGEVHVRFLVRPRGRAEGSTAQKHRGMSEKAARCIADVVDRRFVGYPDAEMVGATLVVKVSKKKQ